MAQDATPRVREEFESEICKADSSEEVRTREEAGEGGRRREKAGEGVRSARRTLEEVD